MSAVPDDRPALTAIGVPFARRHLDAATVMDALATQMRVINALMLRETKTRYGNHKIGFLWALIEPSITVSVFVALFSTFRHDQPGGMPLAPFLLVGFMAFNLLRDPWSQMQASIASSRQLLAFPQVTTFDVMLSRALLEIAVTLLVFVFLLCMLALLGYETDVQRPLGVLAALGLMAMLAIGTGFLFGSLEPLVPSIKQFTSSVIGRPLYFASGLFFTIDSLPPAAIEILLWNPVLHLIELTRGEFFHQFETTHGSWAYASAWSVGMLATGLVAQRALRKRAMVAR